MLSPLPGPSTIKQAMPRAEVGHAVAVLNFLVTSKPEEHHAGWLAAGPAGVHEQRRQAWCHTALTGSMCGRMTAAASGRFHRLAICRGSGAGALAGLVIALRAHEAGRGGQPMALLLLVAPARHDLVAHADPFVEPGIVVADVASARPTR
jgi:hypothetical protein